MSSSFFYSYSPPEKICIEVKGAVKNPGRFYVYPGTFLQKILQKAKPLKSADLSFSKAEIVQKSRVIEVGFRKSITVFVSGALENPGFFELPAGSTFGALLPSLKLKEGAFIKRGPYKKILKHQEEILIPVR